VAEAPDLGSLIDRIAAQHGVEGPLVHSVIQTESNYNPIAVSPKGAQGLMQLIPSTAKRFGVRDAFNVSENIEGGVRYLRFLLDYYGNDYARTIAAYNAGEGAVDKYKGIPPYAETRNYVYTVARNLKAARARMETKTAAAAPIAVDTRSSIIAFTGSDGKLYYRTP
jgi:soluble lytic murein transglycosylase-like protein